MSGALLSPRFDLACRLAAIVHAPQDRKGTRIPYIIHPLHVARLPEEVLTAFLRQDHAAEGVGEDSIGSF